MVGVFYKNGQFYAIKKIILLTSRTNYKIENKKYKQNVLNVIQLKKTIKLIN